MPLETRRFYQFGSFRLDAQQRLLFRDGQPVPLTPKAVDALVLLVKNADRVVTKNELTSHLWPDTHVEEQNLTYTIWLVRKALGDDINSGNPFIETFTKRGYRFIATITESETASIAVPVDADVEPIVTHQPAASVAPKSKRLAYVIGAFAFCAIVGGITLAWIWPRTAPKVLSFAALTSDRKHKDASLVTDGPRVYFYEKDGDSIAPFSVSAQGGVPLPVAPSEGLTTGVSADQSVRLVEKSDNSLWIVGIPPSGLPRRVEEITAYDGVRLSPDGRRIAYRRQQDIYVAKADGSDSRKLVTAPGEVQWIRWSPDGKVLRFTVTERHADVLPTSIWEVSADGSHLNPVLKGWRDPPSECCGDWTPDGKYFIFQAIQSSTLVDSTRFDLWVTREKISPFEKRAQPLPLTSGPINFGFIAPSPNGKHIFAIGMDRKGELSVWDTRRGEFVPYLGGPSAEWVTFSPDRSWIAYVDYATHTLWRMRANGSEPPQQLTFEPMLVDGVAISPDGKSIAIRALLPGKVSRIYTVSSTGGRYRILIPDWDQNEGIPSWSSDGRHVVFSDVPQAMGQDDGSHAIRVYNLDTHQVSSLPGSEGLWTARWSPDGRYICAVTISNDLPLQQDLRLYDVKTKKWSDLRVDHVSDPVWSHDSKYIYVDRYGRSSLGSLGIFQVSISSGRVERVADFSKIRSVLRVPGWIGLDTDDSPIILRNVGTEEIYSLDVSWP